ncbi:hypothetical protein RF11_00016 [Thelohanellus kitauei]|uniref:Uncharacterized protein n=1 Tax=Thelohanellus kitauei TaxID=669202 RepID=A0A0C2NJ34_THEKT|nr:hypothetical protein RF11_00016 [Thelohanellus kitauei]
MAKGARSRSKKRNHSDVRESDKFKNMMREKMINMLSRGEGPNMLVQKDSESIRRPNKKNMYDILRGQFLSQNLRTLTKPGIKAMLKKVPEWDKSRLSRQIKKNRKVQKQKHKHRK